MRSCRSRRGVLQESSKCLRSGSQGAAIDTPSRLKSLYANTSRRPNTTSTLPPALLREPVAMRTSREAEAVRKRTVRTIARDETISSRRHTIAGVRRSSSRRFRWQRRARGSHTYNSNQQTRRVSSSAHSSTIYRLFRTIASTSRCLSEWLQQMICSGSTGTQCNRLVIYRWSRHTCICGPNSQLVRLLMILCRPIRE